jgi:hypothetical protein
MVRSPNRSRRLLCIAQAGVLVFITGCAADNVFKHRFSSCIARIDAIERSPQMTVFPRGHDKTDYCFRYARSAAAPCRPGFACHPGALR